MAINMKATNRRATNGPSLSLPHRRLLSSSPTSSQRYSFHSRSDTLSRDNFLASSASLQRIYPSTHQRTSLSSTKRNLVPSSTAIPSRSAPQVGALEALLAAPVPFVPATSLTSEDEAKMVAILRQRKVACKTESAKQLRQRRLHQHISPHWDRQRREGLCSQGMHNTTGVQCYRNSGLQGLLHVPKFVNWLELIHTKAKCAKNDCLACALRGLSEAYWMENPPSPNAHREAIEKALERIDVLADRLDWNKNRDPNQQQDAEEYFQWLLETLKTQLRASATLCSLFYRHGDFTITCSRPKCGHRSTTSEEQHNLQVPISSPSNNRYPRLTDYVTKSMRDTVDDFRCPNPKCKDKAPKRRTFTLTSAPPILVIQQKRFTYDLRKGSSRKLTHRVSFGEWLDLSSHSDDGSDIRYRLVAVVNHAGSLSGGHYITMAKGPDAQWREMNDSMVRGVSFGEARDPGGRWTPYLLFYQRVERMVADI